MATLGTSHRGSIRGVRSSLSGDIENITRVLRREANRLAVTPVTRGLIRVNWLVKRQKDPRADVEGPSDGRSHRWASTTARVRFPRRKTANRP